MKELGEVAPEDVGVPGQPRHNVLPEQDLHRKQPLTLSPVRQAAYVPLDISISRCGRGDDVAGEVGDERVGLCYLCIDLGGRKAGAVIVDLALDASSSARCPLCPVAPVDDVETQDHVAADGDAFWSEIALATA